MSSICGIIDFKSERTNFDRVKGMSCAMVMRGRDQSGAYIRGGVSLLHGRLICSSPESERQPMTLISREREYTAVLDGEIINREEIAKGLGLPSPRSSAELLLSSYILRDIDFVGGFEGSFAFALYDQRQNRVILGRDKNGSKPLFYSMLSGGKLAFASEIKALLTLFDGIEIEKGGIHAAILGEATSPQELYRGIDSVPSGQMLLCDPLETKRIEYKKFVSSKGKIDGEAVNVEYGQRAELPDEKGLGMILRAFDYPFFDEYMPWFINTLDRISNVRKALVADPMSDPEEEFSLCRADRLGMQRGIYVTLKTAENGSKPRLSYLHRYEKELSRRSEELLRKDGCHLKLFCGEEKLRSDIERMPLGERLSSYARLIEAELWLRGYPIIPL